MIVSNFELIFKPQAPADAAGIKVETVLQGYFLQVTNLEDEPFLFGFDFVISPPPVGTPDRSDRSLAGNCVVFADTSGVDNLQGALNGNINSSVFTPSFGNVQIPARGTAKIALLPAAFGPTPLPAPPNLEVRGFVRLRLPPVFIRFGSFFLRRPQASSPVKVLVAPQNRATYFSGNQVSNQTQASVPVASGQGLIEVEPEGPFFLPAPAGPFEVPTPERIPPMLATMESMASDAPEMPVQMLASLLSGLGPNELDIGAFNRALAEADIEFELTRKPARA